MSFSHDPRADRPSDAPLAVDLTGSTSLPPELFGDSTLGRALHSSANRLIARVVGHVVARIPPQYLGLSGYLLAGVGLGLVLILAFSLGRGGSGDAQAASLAAAAGGADGTTSAMTATTSALTDNVTRLHAREIGTTCWQGIENEGTARLTVSLEIGIDGRVRYAAAAGESAAMRSCVEAHARSWEFLPQAQPTTMALPFEVDRR